MAYNIETITNQFGRTSILLRHAQRDGTKIRKKTSLISPSSRPKSSRTFEPSSRVVQPLLISMNTWSSNAPGLTAMSRQLLGVLVNWAWKQSLHGSPSRQRSLALAAIMTRLIAPQSKRATARTLSAHSAANSLGSLLQLGDVSGNDMLTALIGSLNDTPALRKLSPTAS